MNISSAFGKAPQYDLTFEENPFFTACTLAIATNFEAIKRFLERGQWFGGAAIIIMNFRNFGVSSDLETC